MADSLEQQYAQIRDDTDRFSQYPGTEGQIVAFELVLSLEPKITAHSTDGLTASTYTADIDVHPHSQLTYAGNPYSMDEFLKTTLPSGINYEITNRDDGHGISHIIITAHTSDKGFASDRIQEAIDAIGAAASDFRERLWDKPQPMPDGISALGGTASGPVLEEPGRDGIFGDMDTAQKGIFAQVQRAKEKGNVIEAEVIELQQPTALTPDTATNIENTSPARRAGDMMEAFEQLVNERDADIDNIIREQGGRGLKTYYENIREVALESIHHLNDLLDADIAAGKNLRTDVITNDIVSELQAGVEAVRQSLLDQLRDWKSTSAQEFRAAVQADTLVADIAALAAEYEGGRSAESIEQPQSTAPQAQTDPARTAYIDKYVASRGDSEENREKAGELYDRIQASAAVDKQNDENKVTTIGSSDLEPDSICVDTPTPSTPQAIPTAIASGLQPGEVDVDISDFEKDAAARAAYIGKYTERKGDTPENREKANELYDRIEGSKTAMESNRATIELDTSNQAFQPIELDWKELDEKLPTGKKPEVTAEVNNEPEMKAAPIPPVRKFEDIELDLDDHLPRDPKPSDYDARTAARQEQFKAELEVRLDPRLAEMSERYAHITDASTNKLRPSDPSRQNIVDEFWDDKDREKLRATGPVKTSSTRRSANEEVMAIQDDEIVASLRAPAPESRVAEDTNKYYTPKPEYHPEELPSIVLSAQVKDDQQKLGLPVSDIPLPTQEQRNAQRKAEEAEELTRAETYVKVQDMQDNLVAALNGKPAAKPAPSAQAARKEADIPAVNAAPIPADTNDKKPDSVPPTSMDMPASGKRPSALKRAAYAAAAVAGFVIAALGFSREQGHAHDTTEPHAAPAAGTQPKAPEAPKAEVFASIQTSAPQRDFPDANSIPLEYKNPVEDIVNTPQQHTAKAAHKAAQPKAERPAEPHTKNPINLTGLDPNRVASVKDIAVTMDAQAIAEEFAKKGKAEPLTHAEKERVESSNEIVRDTLREGYYPIPGSVPQNEDGSWYKNDTSGTFGKQILSERSGGDKTPQR